MVFDRGNQIGKLAQTLFPGGVDVSPPSPKYFKQALEKTQQLLQNNFPVIYEAAFVGLNTLIYCDILVKTNNGYCAYEVKSSLKISKTYLQDAALQYTVLKNTNLPITNFYLVTINGDYCLEEAFDIHQFFKITEVTSSCINEEGKIQEEIKKMIAVLQQDKIPNIAVGQHCNQPYTCDFKGTCWKDISSDSIYTLNGITKELLEEWKNKGVTTIAEIDDFTELNQNLTQQIIARKTDKAIINDKAIKNFIASITYPITFFDIEADMPAMPKYKGMRPFQLLPVMFSALTLLEDKTLKNHFWMHDSLKDPREYFLKALQNLIPKEGSIVVFDKTSESLILNSLLKDFPAYQSAIDNLKSRMIDLAIPFAERWYYHPLFNGGHSLKTITAHLLRNNPYQSMDINGGALAMLAYQKMMESVDIFETAELAEKLKNYSQADVLVLKEILDFLKINLPN